MKTSLFLAFLLGAIAHASAQLIPFDYKIAGDQLLTRDLRTGLEWLDIPLTFNRSYEQIEAELAPGGEFDGFRFATRAEFDALHLSFGVPVSHDPFGHGLDPALIARSFALQSLLGFGILDQDPTWIAYVTGGFLDSTEPLDVPTDRWFGRMQVLYFDEPARPDFYLAASFPVEPVTTPFNGAFLVRRFAPVPEPSTYALGAPVLLGGVIAFRRRRHARGIAASR